MKKEYEIPLSFSSIRISAVPVGEDLALTVSGGSRPHIGCVVLSEPRASLSGSGSVSCTSSVISRTGHKDEQICRSLSEKACTAFNKVVVCTGGFHMDRLTAEQLSEIVRAVECFKF